MAERKIRDMNHKVKFGNGFRSRLRYIYPQVSSGISDFLTSFQLTNETYLSRIKFTVYLILAISFILPFNRQMCIARDKVIIDTTLSEGIRYKMIKIKGGRYQHILHLLEADLKNPNCSLAVMLANNKAGTLQKLHNMADTYDATTEWSVVGAVNGSFWKAYNAFPIGPTFVNGYIIEMPSYKKWSSVFFDYDNKPYFGRFQLKTTIIDRKSRIIDVDYVNRRKSENGIVMYNHFAGDSIPSVFDLELDQILDQAMMEQLQDTIFDDQTEEEFDMDEYEAEVIRNKKISDIEFSLEKIALEFIDEPAINREIQCKVTDRANTSIGVPENGAVLSFGTDIPRNLIPRIGDTIYLMTKTDKFSDIEFLTGLSATPRLVTNGKAEHEAGFEGSRSRRFISRRLPRTAIGASQNGDTLYLGVVQPGSRKWGTKGASLQDLAVIMKKTGSWNAMNLDGGGSSIMMIGRENVSRENQPLLSRRIAVAVALLKVRDTILDNIIDMME